jgi:hypothetical protein
MAAGTGGLNTILPAAQDSAPVELWQTPHPDYAGTGQLPNPADDLRTLEKVSRRGNIDFITTKYTKYTK